MYTQSYEYVRKHTQEAKRTKTVEQVSHLKYSMHTY